MEPQLQEAIAKLLAATEESKCAAQAAAAAAVEGTRASNGAKAAANATTTEVQRLGRQYKVLSRQVESLWGRVFGGPPPFPPDGVDPALTPTTTWSDPPLVHAVDDAKEHSSSTALEVSGLEGRVIAGFAALGARQDAMHTELTKQSKDMGIGARGWNFLLSKAGQRSILRTVGAVSALGAMIGTLVVGCRGQMAAPVTQQAPTMILLPAAPAAPAAPTSTFDAGVTRP